VTGTREVSQRQGLLQEDFCNDAWRERCEYMTFRKLHATVMNFYGSYVSRTSAWYSEVSSPQYAIFEATAVVPFACSL
jgi:hypothetical protein